MGSFLRGGLPWLALWLVAAGAPASDGSMQRVAYAELLEAMRAEQGYDARKTTNLARFRVRRV